MLIVSGLSIVELAVLVSAKHKMDSECQVNFAMTFELYQQHIKRNLPNQGSSRGFSRATFFSVSRCQYLSMHIPIRDSNEFRCLIVKAFERLCHLGVFQEGSRTRSSNRLNDYSMVRLTAWAHDIDTAVVARGDAPQQLKKFCKNMDS